MRKRKPPCFGRGEYKEMDDPENQASRLHHALPTQRGRCLACQSALDARAASSLQTKRGGDSFIDSMRVQVRCFRPIRHPAVAAIAACPGSRLDIARRECRTPYSA